MSALIRALGPSDDIVLNSRLIYFPTVYLRSMDARMRPGLPRQDQTGQGTGSGIRCADQRTRGRSQLVRVHSGTEYWVASLGFWPGLPFMMALDPRCVITAPKYNPPRTWTPQGTVGMGGASTAIYPVATPGGYQIFARIPCRSGIRESASRCSRTASVVSPGRPGEVRTSRRKGVRGRRSKGGRREPYGYNVVGYQKFSVKDYKVLGWSLDRGQPFLSSHDRGTEARSGNVGAGLSWPHRLLEPGISAVRSDGCLVLSPRQCAGRQCARCRCS